MIYYRKKKNTIKQEYTFKKKINLKVCNQLSIGTYRYFTLYYGISSTRSILLYVRVIVFGF